MLEAAEHELVAAAKHARPGRFQLEAAMQSVHAERARSGRTAWRAIAWFYEQLVQLAPTLGARIGRASAMAEVHGPAAGLALLAEINRHTVALYQPYWTVRAHLLQRLG
jgi:RNA polymerase sigma-70 factor (ECF subfamily)